LLLLLVIPVVPRSPVLFPFPCTATSESAARVSDSRLLGLNLDPKTKQQRAGVGFGTNVNKDGTPRSKL
jgi:hypothetical protein